jgi:hypothetical protein
VRHYAERHYAEHHYAERHYAERHYAEHHYAERRYSECRTMLRRLGTVDFATNVSRLFFLLSQTS